MLGCILFLVGSFTPISTTTIFVLELKPKYNAKVLHVKMVWFKFMNKWNKNVYRNMPYTSNRRSLETAPRKRNKYCYLRAVGVTERSDGGWLALSVFLDLKMFCFRLKLENFNNFWTFWQRGARTWSLMENVYQYLLFRGSAAAASSAQTTKFIKNVNQQLCNCRRPNTKCKWAKM